MTMIFLDRSSSHLKKLGSQISSWCSVVVSMYENTEGMEDPEDTRGQRII